MHNLRKNITKALFLMCFIVIFNFSIYESFASNYSYINGTNINVRSKPTSSAKITANLSNKKVTITATSGNWSKISCGNIKGWVRNDFLKSASKKSVKTAASAKKVAPASTVKYAMIKGSNVNIRSKNSTNSKVIAKLSNKKVKILSTTGEWYKISADGKEGWVKKEFVTDPGLTSRQLETKSTPAVANNSQNGVIKGTDINLRSKPSKTARIVGKLSNKKVKILSSSGDWYKISYGKTTGWVLNKYVTVSVGNNSSNLAMVNRKETTFRSRLILYSRGFLGTRYVYGGSAPGGFDCSGFTSYVYRKFGIKIERTASAQSRQGKYVPKNKLQPGDLVFFKTDNSAKPVTHAGIYIGNGKFIHASSSRSKHKVTISSLSENFYAKTYVVGKTFIK
ncbi:MAG: SH3 domain-containing protein [Deltaproteobacteria bacterium]